MRMRAQSAGPSRNWLLGRTCRNGTGTHLSRNGAIASFAVTTRLGSAARRRPFSTTSYWPRPSSKSSCTRSSTDDDGGGVMEAPFAHAQLASDRSRNRGTGCQSARSASSGWDSSAGGQGRSWNLCGKGASERHMAESAADLDIIGALVAWLAALALGSTVLVDFAVDRVAGIGAAVAALGIGFLLDHQLAAVPARLGGRLAGGAVLSARTRPCPCPCRRACRRAGCPSRRSPSRGRCASASRP